MFECGTWLKSTMPLKKRWYSQIGKHWDNMPHGTIEDSQTAPSNIATSFKELSQVIFVSCFQCAACEKSASARKSQHVIEARSRKRKVEDEAAR